MEFLRNEEELTSVQVGLYCNENYRFGLVVFGWDLAIQRGSSFHRNPLFLSESGTPKLLNGCLCCFGLQDIKNIFFFSSQTGANCLSGKLPGREADWDSGYSDG